MRKKSLGKALRKIRLKRNMNLREFSKFIGVSHAYIYKIENVNNFHAPIPTIDTLKKISKALEIPFHKFLYMCGYFDDDYESDTKIDDSIENEIIDIKIYVKEFIFDLKNAKAIICNNKIVSKNDINMFVQTLKVALELVKKNSAK